VSGSAPATVAAMGRMVYPDMTAAGFRDKFSLGLIASSAETALLIPPSITLIIYGWMTGASVARLFRIQIDKQVIHFQVKNYHR
jgi:C4-dicarboxylate transporter DctM subunit